MAEPPAMRILVVCAANQCRSRVAESLLQQLLPASLGVEISSAGTRAFEPAPLCAKAAGFLEDAGLHPDRIRVGRELTQQLLADADLVLAADRQVRAGIAAIDPDSRLKTASLRQTGWAAENLLNQQIVGRARAAFAAGNQHLLTEVDGEPDVLAAGLGPGKAAAVSWLIGEIAVAHGYVAAPDGYDILDAHESWRPRHARTLEQIREAVVPIAQLLRELFATS